MRGVSRWASHVTSLLAVFVVFVAGVAWADEPPLTTGSPQARASPPVGVTTQSRLQPPVGIGPPPPDETTQARAQPPVGAPTSGKVPLLDMILIWLQTLRTPEV
jgi:hypothetical protein